MSSTNVVVDVIADGVADFLRRLCDCERKRGELGDRYALVSVADEVIRAANDGRSIDLGNVRVEVAKRLFRRIVTVRFMGRSMTVDEFLVEVSKARSALAWYENDCSSEAVLEPIYRTDDRPTIEYVRANYDAFKTICAGSIPDLAYPPDFPAYAKMGIEQGIRKYSP